MKRWFMLFISFVIYSNTTCMRTRPMNEHNPLRRPQQNFDGEEVRRRHLESQSKNIADQDAARIREQEEA